MPKESVGHRPTEALVKMGWGRDTGVQIGVELCDERELVVTNHGGPPEEIRGVFADLDRRDCNELIKLLRRARNAAFGGDE